MGAVSTSMQKVVVVVVAPMVVIKVRVVGPGLAQVTTTW